MPDEIAKKRVWIVVATDFEYDDCNYSAKDGCHPRRAYDSYDEAFNDARTANLDEARLIDNFNNYHWEAVDDALESIFGPIRMADHEGIDRDNWGTFPPDATDDEVEQFLAEIGLDFYTVVEVSYTTTEPPNDSQINTSPSKPRKILRGSNAQGLPFIGNNI